MDREKQYRIEIGVSELFSGTFNDDKKVTAPNDDAALLMAKERVKQHIKGARDVRGAVYDEGGKEVGIIYYLANTGMEGNPNIAVWEKGKENQGPRTRISIFYDETKKKYIRLPAVPQKPKCENCSREGVKKPARYREIYRDLTGTDVCEQHLMSKGSRGEWSRKGDLERVFDYELEKEVDPITLQP